MDFKTETQLRQELAQAWALVDAYKEDSQRLQFLIDSRATVQYSQRDREGAPHVEVLGDQWCRRKTLREALDVLRSNARVERPCAASGARSARTTGCAAGAQEEK